MLTIVHVCYWWFVGLLFVTDPAAVVFASRQWFLKGECKSSRSNIFMILGTDFVQCSLLRLWWDVGLRLLGCCVLVCWRSVTKLGRRRDTPLLHAVQHTYGQYDRFNSSIKYYPKSSSFEVARQLHNTKHSYYVVTGGFPPETHRSWPKQSFHDSVILLSP
jgi:hypothetical protein